MKTLKLYFIILCTVSVFLIVNSAFAQWELAGQVPGAPGFTRISVADSNVVWVTGGSTSPRIYRTVNGGLNWTSINTTGLPYVLHGLAAKDSLTAFVSDYGGSFSGGNAKFFKTTNAGLNWMLIDSTGGNQGFYNDVIFSKSEPSVGFALSDPPNGPGNPYILNKTTNGGLNWFRTNPPGVPSYLAIDYGFFTIDHLFYGFVIGNYSTISFDTYITSNGGASWYRGGENLSYSNVSFHDNKRTGILVSHSILPNIKRTTNGGLNWYSVNSLSGITGSPFIIWISGTNSVFMSILSNSSNSILRSDDGGQTWVSQSTSGINGLFEIDYARYNDLIISYCLSDNNEIIKSRQTVQPVGIEQISNTIPQKLYLYQNYPNPFNPVTKVNYELPITNYVTLKIHDVLGKEVASLVNEKQNAGSYSVDFNAGNLPSGIYYYTIKAGEFTGTRKMMLIK